MNLTGQDITQITALTHDGKVLIFGTTTGGVICYSVKRSGFEDTAISPEADPFGFEAWQLLRLGDSDNDESVVADEQQSLTDASGGAILRSAYGKSSQVTLSPGVASVQVISAMNLVYVFRQSATDGKILVSRFVLDGMSNQLLPRLDVRFRRSRQRLAPQQAATSKNGTSFDNLDYRDIDGNSFFEPAVELGFIGATSDGWFSVVLVPTSESDRQRWHVFAHDPAARKLVLHSVGCGPDGLFDVKDYLYGMKDPSDPDNTIYRSIPGIIRRTLDLPGMTIADCPSATTYDLQKEQMTDAGPQLMRDVMRVMLAVPVRVGGQDPVRTAVLDFAVAADGTLSQIDLTPDTSVVLRSDAREVVTPLSLFDTIKEFASSAPPPTGTIVATERGSEDNLQIRCKEALPAGLEAGSKVKIRGTRSYDGHYSVVSADGATFQVEATFQSSEVGTWEIVPDKTTGLVFDNMVVGTEKTADGKLKVLCPAHDLKVGDEVQISGTSAYDGVFPVLDVDPSARNFVLEASFFTGEVANLGRVRRRGLRMDGDDSVETPDLELLPPSPERDLGRTMSAWVFVDAAGNLEQTLVKDSGGMMSLALGSDGKVKLLVRMSNGAVHTVTDPAPITAGVWTHYAGSMDYDTKKAGDTRLSLCRKGVQVAQSIVAHDLPSHLGDQVIAFDGVDDGVEAAQDPPNLAGKSYSVEMWLKRARSGVQEFAFWQGTESALNGGLHIGFRGNDAFTFATWGNDLNTNGTYPDADWHHYACTYNHQTRTKRAYRDGVLIGELVTDSHFLGTGAPSIGRFNSGGCPFQGNIADVRVWGRARTQAEIQGEMARRMLGREAGLLAYWPLDNGTTKDLSPAKRHGALKGSPAWTKAAYLHPQTTPPAATGARIARVMQMGGQDFIEVLGAPPDFADRSFSIEVFAKRTRAGLLETLVSQGVSSANRHLFFGFAPDDTFVLGFSGNDCGTAAAYPDQDWHHYAATYDSVTKTQRIYRDGALVAEQGGADAYLGTGALRIACLALGGSPFKGQMADLRAWTVARSQADIQKWMYRRLRGLETGLAGYWPLDSGAADLSPNKRHGKITGSPALVSAGSVFTIGQGFRGEISDVQVWTEARSAAEVNATMHLELSGKESGLAAYYRMGAVVYEEQPPIVPDFSVLGRNGIVKGDPCAGARRLSRATGSGMKVVKYASDELLAVSQRGVYEESLEFRVTTSDASFDPNDADGLGTRLFTFSYSGKSTRGSAEILPFPSGSIQQSDFQSLGGGWYRATCRLIVPDGVSLMRAFELSGISGKWAAEASPPANEWTALDIRKHHIRLISDAVTRDTYTDVAVLASLPAQPQATLDNLTLMDRADRKVARLEEKVTDLLVRIDVVQNNQRYVNEKNTLTTRLTGLQTQRTTAIGERNAITGEAFNYWHRLRAKHSSLVVEMRGNGLFTYSENGSLEGQLFRFEGQGDGTFLIWVKTSEYPVAAREYKWEVRTGWPLEGVGTEVRTAQSWRLVESGGGWKYIKNGHGYVWDVEGGWMTPGTRLLAWDSAGSDNQRWGLVKTTQLVPAAQTALSARDVAIASLDLQIAAVQDRIAWLSQVLSANEALATLQGQLTTTRSDLSAARVDLATKNTALLALLSQAPLATMPVLSIDDRDLRTAGAVLDFAQPAGTVRLSESCEGNVLLTYADRQGRLRTTVYDATADSRNAAFEQWAPDAVRACADLSDSGDLITLPSAVTLPPSGWTCEAWVRYPVATRPDGSAYPLNLLAAGAVKRDAPLAVRKGNRLGVMLDGWFFDSGVDLQRALVSGFHHLAVSVLGTTASFYADGVKLAGVKARQPVMRLNGTSDHVEVPAHASPAAAVTVSVWARSAGATWNANAPLVSKREAFMMQPRAGTRTMVFSVNVAGAGYKSVECTMSDTQSWHFYTGTYDGSCLRIYADGEFVVESVAAGAIQASTGSLYLGRDPASSASLAGDLADVAIWSAARGPSDVREDSYHPLNGDEAGLCGYWRMETSVEGGVLAVRDLTSNARHGLIQGAPTDATLTVMSAMDLKYLGNAPASGPPVEAYVDGQQQALRLNGTTDHVEVPAHANPTAAVTVSVWARSATASWTKDGFLVAKREAIVMHPVVGTRMMAFYVYVNGLGWKAATFTLADIQAWHSYTGTFDGSNIRLYVDGELVGTTAAAGTLIASPGVMYIGRDVANHLNGDVGDVAVWNVARSAADVRDTWKKPLKGNEAGLIGYWRMDVWNDAGVLKVKDLSSNARHGLIKGAPLTTTYPMSQLTTTPTGTPIGRFAEVRMWSLALSDAEIAVHARGTASGNEPGLLAYWPLNEATGATAHDRSAGGGAHGVMTGVGWMGCAANIGGAGRKVLVLPPRGTPAVVCPTVPIASASFTFECWARRSDSAFGVVEFLATSGSPAANMGFHFDFRENGSLCMGFYANDLSSAQTYADTDWHHLACTYDRSTRTQRLYADGVLVGTRVSTSDLLGAGDLVIGRDSTGTTSFTGQIAEVRVWSRVLQQAELQQQMHGRLSGTEDGLLACYPMDEVSPDGKVKELKTGLFQGQLGGSAALLQTTSLHRAETSRVVTCEYSSIEVGPDGGRQALMRRFHAYPSGGQVVVLPEQRVDALTLQWVGNTQINPTLLGYIEGAPPVPSENLTVEDDYMGATTVAVTQSEETSYTWQRSETRSSAFNLDGFIGGAWGMEAGSPFVKSQLTEGQAGVSFSYAHEKNDTEDTSTGVTSTLTTTDSLTLTGRLEENAVCSPVGARWVPKNVGYALVISGMADVFVTKLLRSGRMVSYDIRPVEGVPLDVNTITFMINPAYTLNGSLDGLVGSSPADETFYPHVPAMRAQYGSLYPASYFRLKQAYALKSAVERQDKARESFFYNFKADQVDKLGQTASPDALNVNEDPGGASPDTPGTEQDEGQAKAQQDEARKEAKAQQDEARKEAKKRKAEIEQMQKSREGRVRAVAAFADWQLRMGNINARAGKRNIVNTYVWDGDGGLRAEEQSFASTIEHTLSAETINSGGMGAGIDAMFAGVKVELSLVGSGGKTEANSKTLGQSKSLELTVDLSGVENKGITDLKDNPMLPGEKVDRYRFMTFYLEGNSDHYADFFAHVVDPEWLMGNDEEARALRMARSAKPNKCWRVLHRVTYVERPALMAVGRDTRALSMDESDAVTIGFTALNSRMDALDAKLETRIGQVLSKLP